MKVFISHSSIDKPFVRRLKKDLQLNYIDTWLDEDELLPGDSLMDKLTSALRASTHFMIVLSPNSVKSDWVNFELDNAFQYVENETLSKIIPIHYRKCNIPKILKPILNIDLTDEIVYLKHGDLEFLGDNYYNNLDPLIRSINHGEKKLLKADKNEIMGKNIIRYSEIKKSVALHYRIIGFKSISNFLANQISTTEKEGYNKKKLSEFKPVVFPKEFKKYFDKLRFGDVIRFKRKDNKIIEGDFARFSSQNNNIAIPSEIRSSLGVTEIGVYKVILNLKDKTITIESVKDK